MSTRQLRLNSTEAILKRSADLVGKKVNIVMKDRTVVFATVQSTDSSHLNVVNMRLRKVRIDIDTIADLYYDTKE